MIPLAPVYLRRAVDLLQEDYPRQGVRQGDGAEGDAGVRLHEHIRGEPQRAAEDKGDVAPPREAQGA